MKQPPPLSRNAGLLMGIRKGFKIGLFFDASNDLKPGRRFSAAHPSIHCPHESITESTAGLSKFLIAQRCSINLRRKNRL